MSLFNQFLADVPITYPLKSPENYRFSSIFKGYSVWTLARNKNKPLSVYKQNQG